MIKKSFTMICVALVVTATLVLTGCPTDAVESGGDSQDSVVSILSLDGQVTAPVKEVAPVSAPIDTAQYTGTIAWQTGAGTPFTGEAFAVSTVYKAVVTLSVKSGFTFTGIAANSFTYTGAIVTNATSSGTVTITFPATTVDAMVSAFDLTELVIVPVAAATPLATVTSAEQYTGSIAWYTNGDTPFNGPTFEAFTVYKALVTLNAKSDYTFTGISENNFIHTGATTVTNAANSGTVAITFPATAGKGSTAIAVGFNYGKITISGSDGSNVISKIGAGGKPISLTFFNAGGYTGVLWYIDGDDARGIDYDAIIIKAADYHIGSHFVTFTGKRDDVPYSQVLPFTVIKE